MIKKIWDSSKINFGAIPICLILIYAGLTDATNYCKIAIICHAPSTGRTGTSVIREFISLFLLVYLSSNISYKLLNRIEEKSPIGKDEGTKPDSSAIRDILSVLKFTIPIILSLCIILIYSILGISWLNKINPNQTWINSLSPIGTSLAALITILGTVSAAFIVYINSKTQRKFDYTRQQIDSNNEREKLDFEKSKENRRFSFDYEKYLDSKLDSFITGNSLNAHQINSLLNLYNDWEFVASSDSGFDSRQHWESKSFIKRSYILNNILDKAEKKDSDKILQAYRKLSALSNDKFFKVNNIDISDISLSDITLSERIYFTNANFDFIHLSDVTIKNVSIYDCNIKNFSSSNSKIEIDSIAFNKKMASRSIQYLLSCASMDFKTFAVSHNLSCHMGIDILLRNTRNFRTFYGITFNLDASRIGELGNRNRNTPIRISNLVLIDCFLMIHPESVIFENCLIINCDLKLYNKHGEFPAPIEINLNNSKTSSCRIFTKYKIQDESLVIYHPGSTDIKRSIWGSDSIYDSIASEYFSSNEFLEESNGHQISILEKSLLSPNNYRVLKLLDNPTAKFEEILKLYSYVDQHTRKGKDWNSGTVVIRDTSVTKNSNNVKIISSPVLNKP
ncbi:hypothetical protein [Rothia nasimurium]|nr:hypothetical protein [Rothia nasimurium]